MKPVRDWISNVVLAALVAAVTLLLVLMGQPAHAQTITWKVDGPAACTVTCAPVGTPTTPPPGPVDPTPPPPPVEPPPADPCAKYAGNFLLYSYCKQGAVKPTPAGDSGTGAPTTGFVLATRGRPLTNTLTAGVPYQYSILSTAKGERVELTILEVVGTPDSIQTTSTVRGPAGEVLSGPSFFGRHATHVIQSSPGGTLTLTVTTTVTAPLGVQRN